jgi:hypothetical protein
MVLTGANRHDKISAVDLIVSMALKLPPHMSEVFWRRRTIPRATNPPPTIIANGPRTNAGGKPPVSGSAGVAVAVAVGEAIGFSLEVSL